MRIRRFFALLLILTLLPLAALAQDALWHAGEGEIWNGAGEHFSYEIEGDHAVLTRYWVESSFPQPAVVRVPAEIAGLPLTVIGWCAFDNFDGIEDAEGRHQFAYDGKQVACIVIPEGVTTLADGAFTCAHSVARIELPSTLETIETGFTFQHVTAEISFPNGNPFYRVEDGFLIDGRTDALLYCACSTQELPLPRVKRIEERALDNYHGEKTALEFPDGVEYIGGWNAYDLPWLEKIIVPSSVTELGDWAFYCNSATEIVLSEGLRKIGAYAFAATSIAGIALPSTLVWIGYNAFGFWDEDDIPVTPPAGCHRETEAEYTLRCYEAEYGMTWPEGQAVPVYVGEEETSVWVILCFDADDGYHYALIPFVQTLDALGYAIQWESGTLVRFMNKQGQQRCVLDMANDSFRMEGIESNLFLLAPGSRVITPLFLGSGWDYMVDERLLYLAFSALGWKLWSDSSVPCVRIVPVE